jgi:leader peptidase (prepilin peptidase)/N-methyltransferase
MITLIISIFVFVFGACIGSFLNVVIYRLPAKISLISPPSRCPKCFHQLGITENVPILGWLVLKGRCRWCKTPISFRYPLIELVTGWLFVLVFLHYDLTLITLGYCILLSWLLALSLIDLDTMTLPNQLTQSGLVLGLIFQGIIGFYNGQLSEQLMFGIFGMVLGVWLLDTINFLGTLIIGKPAMGGADAKLLAMIGVWLGWQYVLLSAFLACLFGSLIGMGAIALKIVSRRQPIPFGPFLALGGALSVFWGETIISTYINLFFNI